MAKKKKKVNADKYSRALFVRTERYADEVRRYFASAVDELLGIAATGNLSPSGGFSFDDRKSMQQKAEPVLRQLYSAVYNCIKGAVTAEWRNANLACDEMIKDIFGKGVMESNHLAGWFSRNQEALDQFLKRTAGDGGMRLSDKVWKYTGDLKREMELALSVSMGTGKSAATISREVRKYLQEPDKLFRRVRTGEDADGNPIYRLSKRASAYHPGRGVYRSSYKNAMRLTRTETNMAYRAADHERWQQLNFVIGIEIRLSNNHTCNDKPLVDICDELAGRYPKTFKFTGWHPQCRCFAVSIIADESEILDMQKRMLAGEDVSDYQFTGVVTEPHDGFKNWVKGNRKRIDDAAERGKLPYFVKDNPELFGISRVDYNSQKGDEDGLGRVSKSYIDIRALSKDITHAASLFPEMVQNGIKSVRVATDPNEGYFAIGKLTGAGEHGFSLKIVNYDFLVTSPSGKNIYYNPAKELNAAFRSIREHRRLTFNQEYALEGLWHEFYHAKALGWESVGDHDVLQKKFMETFNQLTARHTYNTLTSKLGIEAEHQEDIIAFGYGYGKRVSNLMRLIEKSPYTPAELADDMDLIFRNTYYEKLDTVMKDHLISKGVYWAESFLSKLAMDKSKFNTLLLVNNA